MTGLEREGGGGGGGGGLAPMPPDLPLAVGHHSLDTNYGIYSFRNP